MLVIKALHIIAMVAWFAGLFYLPRLFVYHVNADDIVSDVRFQAMEGRLYYFIMWPAALLTTICGGMLLMYNPHYYLQATWMHAKLTLVILLWFYHFYCGYIVKRFTSNRVLHSERFYRIFNEIPTLLLLGIVFLVVFRP